MVQDTKPSSLLVKFYRYLYFPKSFASYLLIVIIVFGTGANTISVMAMTTKASVPETRATLTSNISSSLPPHNGSSSTTSCHCVIFRLSGIQDYFANLAQIAIMDLFMDKNQSLSLGLVMNNLGTDTGIVREISEGFKRAGLFELALNGWNFTDYSKLTEPEQKNSLIKANEKMDVLFGSTSPIFIPPFEAFNNATLGAMRQLDMRIMSSGVELDKNPNFMANASNNNDTSLIQQPTQSNEIIHMPKTTSYHSYDSNGSMIKIPVNKLLSEIDDSITKYGYAVISLEPQFFLNKKGTVSTNLNKQEINDLSSLIDHLNSKNIRITTFSKAAGIEPYTKHIQKGLTAPKEVLQTGIPTTSVKGNKTEGISSAPIDLLNNSSKKVILTFDDNWESQFNSAKPILDKYGFKATFFITCNLVGRYEPALLAGRFHLPMDQLQLGSRPMSWDEIKILHNEGHDIEAHTMNHKNLTALSSSALNFEIGQSKQCLRVHGINSTIMATPFDAGWNNATVINTIAKYFDLARNGNEALTFLRCDGWPGLSNQTDCRTYSDHGKLTFANRYSIRSWSHNFYDSAYLNNSSKIFNEFVQEVNRQANFNRMGSIRAIPVIIYHILDYHGGGHTYPNLFAAEMKYLHDNGFKVLTMADLGYDKNTNYLYIR